MRERGRTVSLAIAAIFPPDTATIWERRAWKGPLFARTLPNWIYSSPSRPADICWQQQWPPVCTHTFEDFPVLSLSLSLSLARARARVHVYTSAFILTTHRALLSRRRRPLLLLLRDSLRVLSALSSWRRQSIEWKASMESNAQRAETRKCTRVDG